MGIRPAKCYRRLKRPYTRTSRRKPKKSYVKGVPVSKIHQFEMGDRTAKFELEINLVSKTDIQIRSNALEACRIAMTKQLTKQLGDKGFFLKVRVYPHHILRENALATGAGADRFSQGMRSSFGKPIGQAAQVKAGQKIATARVNKNGLDAAKLALKRGSAKLPCSCFIRVK